MMVALDQFVRRTRLGRGIRAIAQDPETAVLMGVNIDRVVPLTFLIGGVDGRRRGRALPDAVRGDHATTSASCSASRRSPPRCSAASATCGARWSAASCSAWSSYGSALFGTEWQDVVAFSVLVLVLMFRPTGMLGESLGRARA